MKYQAAHSWVAFLVLAYSQRFCYLCSWISGLRGSIESKLLQRATVPLPAGVLPPRQQEDEIAVCIPYSKSHDPRTYNYITETGKNVLIARIKEDFDLDVWDYLHDFGKIGQQQKDLIYLFMEQRGIHEDGTCWDAIAKIYQRLRNIYRSTGQPDGDTSVRKYEVSFTAKKALALCSV